MFFFFKQKTAYEMRISDWSSYVCSSDLSNVVPLELAFEHRNHSALIGAVLAIGSLLAHGSLHLRVRPAVQSVLCAFFLVALGSATMLRAHSWHSNLTLARASTEAAPTSQIGRASRRERVCQYV